MATLSRRSILKGLATAPVGARQASKEIAEMAGVSVVGPVGGETEMRAVGISSGTHEGRVLAAYKAFGIPDWKKQELRQMARMSRTLDPDIASMRSLSLDAKLRKQWARRERELHKSLFDDLYKEIDREQFFSKHVWGQD